MRPALPWAEFTRRYRSGEDAAQRLAHFSDEIVLALPTP